MSSITGLNPIKGTSITNSGFIALGAENNQGSTGQIIKSNGVNNAAAWGDETIHTNEKLNIGNKVNLTSGNTFYDGSVAETINAVDTIYSGGTGINISGTNSISVTAVPFTLTAGTNLEFVYPGTNYNGSAGRQIRLKDNISISDLTATGTIFLSGLPTADPKNPGQLYKDNYTGQLFVSI
tara:strand:+ start:1425 stop:1967 length:543 start_codon:yes stop_codon:yes gene_type:complete